MKRSVLLFFVGVFFVVFYCHPLLKNFNNWGRYEWDYSLFLQEVPRKTVMEYGQFPLWNPYHFGGQPMLAHPHSRFCSPDFILVLLFGTLWGVKLQIFLYFFLGLWGMYLLSKKLGLEFPATLFAPLIYMGGGFFALHLSYGHIHFLSMALLPLLFFFYLKSLENISFLFGLILCLSIVLVSSGMTIIVISFLFMMGFSLAKSLELEKFSPFFYFLLAVFFSLILSSLKLAPMVDTLADKNLNIKSRTSYRHSDQISLDRLPQIFFGRDQRGYMKNFYHSGMQFGWHEYGLYVGILPAILAILGLGAYFRKLRWHGFFFGAALLLALGNFYSYAPWNMLKALPGMGPFFVVPSRWLLVVLFNLAILSAFGFQWLWTKGGRRREVRVFLALVLVGVSVDLALVNGRIFEIPFSIPPIFKKSHDLPLEQVIMVGPRKATGEPFFNIEEIGYIKKIFQENYPHLLKKYGTEIPYEELQKIYPEFIERFKISLPYGAYSSMFAAVRTNKAVATGYGFSFTLPKVKWSARLNGEVYSPHSSALPIRYKITPNEIKISNYPVPNLLMINQNYFKGWITGRSSFIVVQNFQGCLSFFAGAPDVQISLRYSPVSFIIGSLISGISLYLLITIFSWIYVQNRVQKDIQ